LPSIRANPAVNSILLTVKVCPAWSVPFIYGYAMQPKNLGCFSRTLAAEMEWRGISVVVGALGSKTPSSFHFCWYFFSIAMSVSRLSVCSGNVVSKAQVDRWRGTDAFQFLSFGNGDGLQCLCGGVNGGHGGSLSTVSRFVIYLKVFPPAESSLKWCC
jgi:hypothetical protein